MATFDMRNAPANAMLAEDDLEAGRKFWRDTVGLEEVFRDEYDEVAFKAGKSVFARRRGG
jgi:hypothetical protein